MDFGGTNKTPGRRGMNQNGSMDERHVCLVVVDMERAEVKTSTNKTPGRRGMNWNGSMNERHMGLVMVDTERAEAKTSKVVMVVPFNVVALFVL